MSILFKLRKLERTFSDGRNDTANGKWFARTVYVGTKNINDLAERCAASTTVTKADTLAVIQALVVEMKRRMQDSYKVKLNGLGTFYISVSSRGAVEASEFSVAKNITNCKVNFAPDYTVDSATGQRNYNLMKNVNLRQTPTNIVP